MVIEEIAILFVAWSAGGFASGSVTYLLMMVLTACLQWSARKQKGGMGAPMVHR